jgi:hypothetical protein
MARKTMGIVMKKTVGGTTVYHAGHTYEVSEDVAKDLMKAGYATERKAATPASPQTEQPEGGA